MSEYSTAFLAASYTAYLLARNGRRARLAGDTAALRWWYSANAWDGLARALRDGKPDQAAFLWRGMPPSDRGAVELMDRVEYQAFASVVLSRVSDSRAAG